MKRKQNPVLEPKQVAKMVISPRESAALIASLSKDVSIVLPKVSHAADSIAKGLEEQQYDITSWKKHDLNPKKMDSSTVDWIFFVDTLNFSFWSEPDLRYEVTYNNKTYSGYWSLCAVVNRAIEEGHPLCMPEYYTKLSLEELKNIFRSDSGIEMPMIEERYKILLDTGKVLIEKFGGSFVNCLPLSENSAMKLLKLVVSNFASYRDEAIIDHHEVAFYKRAQILIGDIWACFEGKGYGLFHDIDSITMFADYRIPQVLLYMGVLKYSTELKDRLKTEQYIHSMLRIYAKGANIHNFYGILLQSGERLEVEIRGCSIWAVELICQEMRKKCIDTPTAHKINAIVIDNYLWDFRRNHSNEMEIYPFHKIRCIYY